jgi:hypothetical protein
LLEPLEEVEKEYITADRRGARCDKQN